MGREFNYVCCLTGILRYYWRIITKNVRGKEKGIRILRLLERIGRRSDIELLWPHRIYFEPVFFEQPSRKYSFHLFTLLCPD